MPKWWNIYSNLTKCAWKSKTLARSFDLNDQLIISYGSHSEDYDNNHISELSSIRHTISFKSRCKRNFISRLRRNDSKRKNDIALNRQRRWEVLCGKLKSDKTSRCSKTKSNYMFDGRKPNQKAFAIEKNGLLVKNMGIRKSIVGRIPLSTKKGMLLPLTLLQMLVRWLAARWKPYVPLSSKVTKIRFLDKPILMSVANGVQIEANKVGTIHVKLEN